MMKYSLFCALKTSMLVVLVASVLILTSGLILFFFLNSLLESYFVGIARNLNTTKFLINSQESIVPSKDDLLEEIDLGYLPQIISLVICCVGASLLLFSLFGYIAITTRNIDYLICLVVVITVCIVCQFLIFGCIVDLSSKFNSGAKEKLIATLHGNYEVGARSRSSFTFLMNSLMLMCECCGIEGPADFLEMGIFNFTYVLEDQAYNAPVMFPLACCKRSYIDKGFQATLACAQSKDISNINQMGCYEESYAYVHDNYGKLVTAIFSLLILWEMLQILVGLALLFAPSKVERNAFNTLFETAEYEDISKHGYPNWEPKIKEKPKRRVSIRVPPFQEDINKYACPICEPKIEEEPKRRVSIRVPPVQEDIIKRACPSCEPKIEEKPKLRSAIFVPFATVPPYGSEDEKASQIW